MIRRALLLAASRENNPIPDVYSDLAAVSNFLRSNIGGAWDVNEIFQGLGSTRDQILSAIRAANDGDYCLAFFAGRGELVKMGRPWREMRMVLSSGEAITERELNSGSARCTLILDCSRRTVGQNKETLLFETPGVPDRVEVSSEYRNYYEECLRAAEGGLVRIYATEAGSVSTDAGSFTQQLLREANMWSVTNKGALPLGDAVALARDAMSRESPQQIVEYLGGRRLRHFPFAVQI
jgi:hypothetical protein